MKQEYQQENSDFGWVKIHRTIQDNPICKKPEWAWLWVNLILDAAHEPHKFMWNGSNFIIERGQLVTSRKTLSRKCKLSESSVERCLKYLENGQQIEQQTFNTFRLISIVNYSIYQKREQQNEQQLDSNWTATGQQLDTYKNEKNEKNEKNTEKFSPAPDGPDENFSVEQKNPEVPGKAVELDEFGSVEAKTESSTRTALSELQHGSDCISTRKADPSQGIGQGELGLSTPIESPNSGTPEGSPGADVAPSGKKKAPGTKKAAFNLAKYLDVWKARYGGNFVAVHYAKAVKKLESDHGEDAVFSAFKAYVAKTEPQFASMRTFISKPFMYGGPRKQLKVTRKLTEWE
ncbi:MAG: hypothetical protein EOM12_03480 [Verrucomicrobiae bacterium]|nr:hypothetical protein [Verrucomicrobiae bacterium]